MQFLLLSFMFLLDISIFFLRTAVQVACPASPLRHLFSYGWSYHTISISRIFAYLISENDVLLLSSQMCICLVVSLYLLIRLYFVFCESLVHPVFSFSLDSFKLWTNHPAFGVAKITLCLALGLGIILTIWLHLPYIPGLQKLSFFSWIGTVMSFCEGAL